jgi:hypothetical protein
MNFNLCNDLFKGKNNFEGQFLYIEIFFCKSDFFHFLVLKTGKLSNFTIDKFFVPFVSVYIDHFPVKVQVENFQKVSMHVVAPTCA